jgi:hypothetical protein
MNETSHIQIEPRTPAPEWESVTVGTWRLRVDGGYIYLGQAGWAIFVPDANLR